MCCDEHGDDPGTSPNTPLPMGECTPEQAGQWCTPDVNWGEYGPGAPTQCDCNGNCIAGELLLRELLPVRSPHYLESSMEGWDTWHPNGYYGNGICNDASDSVPNSNYTGINLN